MTTTTDILHRVRTLIQDSGAVRWSTAELMGWLNEAYGAIVNLRPDASAGVTEFQCAPGTRQQLLPTLSRASRFLDAVRNTSPLSRGGAISELARDKLDTQRRFWHAETATVDLEYYLFDPRLPTAFQVYPPAVAGAAIELVYAFVPAPHAVDAVDEAIKLDDAYTGALVDYIVYRAYSKNAEYATDTARAMTHYQAMQAALGMKAAGDQSVHSIRANPADAARSA